MVLKEVVDNLMLSVIMAMDSIEEVDNSRLFGDEEKRGLYVEIMEALEYSVDVSMGGREAFMLGMDLSALSVMGILAASGVVVNDSLVLVDYINRRRIAGETVFKAASSAGAARFRAIILTSATTFAGLFPLIRMQETQAQFLIPMAVSLGYGILFATLITLILVPVNYLVMNDISVGFKRIYGKSEEADSSGLEPSSAS